MKKLLLFLFLLLFAAVLYAQEKDESILTNLTNVLTEQYAIEDVVGSFDFTVGTSTQARAVYAGSDINQNGLYEVIFTSYSDGGKVHVFEIDGDNNASEIWTSPNIGSSSSSNVRGVHVADLDGNGDFELVLSVNGSGGVDDAVGGLMIYEYSMATTSWDAGYHTVIDSGALSNRWNIEGFDIFDVDNDGKEEIMISNNGTGSFDSCYVISFNGTFDGGATQVTEFAWGKNASTPLGGSAMNATYGDLDGDGNYEALFGIWDNCAILVVEATAPDTYEFKNYIKMDLTGGDAVPLDNIIAVDLDNDGRDEVYATLYSGAGSGALMGMRCVTELDSMTQTNSVYEVAAPGESGGYGIASGDVDGNGDVSLYTAAYASGRIISHEYTGGDITDPLNYTASILGEHPTVTGSFGLFMSDVDMDGDGYNELLVSYTDGNVIIGTAYEYSPVVTAFPYIVDFEDGGNIPTDWSHDPANAEDWKFDIPGGGSNPVQYGATHDHTSGTGYVAWVDDSSPTTQPANLLTPPLDLTSLTNPGMTFWYWIGVDDDLSELHVDVYDGTAWNDDVKVVTGNGAWEIVGVDLTPYKSSTTQVRFRALESTGFRSDITIDDVAIGEAPIIPIISVSSDSLNFGIANVLDTTAAMTLTISNIGGGTLHLTSIALLDDTDFVLIDTNSYPIMLSAFEAANVDVAFSPATAGLKATQLDITYPVQEDVASVYLTGNGVNFNHGGGPADPLSGGYYFANSQPGAASAPAQPLYNWIDISTTGTSILAGLSDDNIVGPYDIGFAFNYFGTDYTQFWVSSNGWISFDDNAASTGSQQRVNITMPDATLPNNIIALFWDDMNPADADVLNKECIYGYDADSNLVVSMINYPEFGADVDGWVTAQIILKRNGNIKLQYANHGASIDLDGSTVGIENSDGTLGLTYRFNGIGGPIFSSPVAIEFGLDSTQIPVELTSFAASTNDRDVVLSWQTATESNSDKYVVQRSIAESEEWTAIGEIKSAGNSTVKQSYSFTDTKLNTNSYEYRLKMVDFDGTYEYSNRVEVTIGLPTEFTLSQNYPNPFNPSTKIEYALPVDSKVKLELYSITGEKVATVVNEEQSAGYHTAEFNSSAIASGLASGIYIYRIAATGNNNKNFVSVKKMMLLK
ncbi:MAG: T9SS type A sorting domain-containing protein [Ignavibacteriae bacterium]|nr:T9SS C-terminal target domain-containing protein [Ignavibacteriota bacterium]NOG98114.1 T9SS type A sorting domain-containing protein [Ignavibacteriota bacterium]